MTSLAMAPAVVQDTLQHFFVSSGVRENLPYALDIKINPEMVPEPWQVSGLNQALAFSRFGLFDQPGCMKTMPAQAFALYMAGYGNKVVCVMPPALLEQWSESFASTFLGYQEHFHLHTLQEGPAKRAKLFKKWRETQWPDLLCMSYQMFSKVPRQRKKKIEGGVEIIPANPDDYISDVLKSAGYRVVIADEAQALRNSESMTYKTVEYLLGEEEDSALLLMTGTPLHNNLLDAYGLINLLTPGKYASLKTFKRLHCIYKYDDDGRDVLVGFQNRDTLTRSLYARARRITKEVLHLKKPQVIEVPVKLDPTHHRLYKKLINERFLEYGDEIILADNQQSLRQKALKIVTNPHEFSKKKIANNVVSTVLTLIDGIDINEEKVVVFANFRMSIETLTRAMDAAGYNPVAVYGGAGNNARNIRKFLDDGTCRVMVSNPESGGVGLNLQGVCRYVIFAEPTSVPGRFQQAGDRVHRKGQTEQVTFYLVKVIGTTSVGMTHSMLQKEGEALGVLGDRDSILSDLLGM